MSLSPSLISYESEIMSFERAKASEHGIRIEFETHGQAKYYAARLHQARTVDRRDNTRIGGESSPMHGRSEFDSIRIKLREDEIGHWWVYLEKNDVIPGYVEDL